MTVEQRKQMFGFELMIIFKKNICTEYYYCSKVN